MFQKILLMISFMKIIFWLFITIF
jgi:hypothetical protein